MGENGTKNLPALQGERNVAAAPAAASRGVVISSMDALLAFADTVVKSRLAPKDFQSRESVAIAIQHGLELGLLPLQALHSVAVINGKPGIYGDAALALVEGSGLLEDHDEWLEAGGKRVESVTAWSDDVRAVCSTKRKGRKTARVTTFSVADAKKASLWGKAGPWSSYPGRMLQFRARGFNLRDNFPDVLKGIKTVEELQDYPESGAATPSPTPKRVEAEVVSVAAATGVAPDKIAKPATVDQAQANELRQLVQRCVDLGDKKALESFRKTYKVQSAQQLPAEQFEAARQSLTETIAELECAAEERAAVQAEACGEAG